MADFRFEGLALNGRPVHGVIQAEKLSEAKQKAEALANARKFKLQKLLPRKTFVYKIRKGGDKPTRGEQKAFSKEEVRAALQRLNYEVISVQPKLLNFRGKPPETEIVTFVRVSADLLREQLPYNEVLELLVNDIENASLRESIKEVNQDLKHGKDSEEAFIRQEKYLGKFTARMLGLASKSGNMIDIYEATATFLERNQEFKKSMKSALIMPLFTLFLLFLAVLFYVAYIFPKTAELFVKMGIELPPMTDATLKLSYFLLDNMLFIGVGFVLLTGGFLYSMRLRKVQFLRDKLIIRMPVIGPLLHKMVIEIFCRVFYALYSGSGESIDAIKLSAEACGNKYMTHRIKTIAIPLMLAKGTGIVHAFEASGVFTKTALARFHSGAETGTVKKTALQIANYYQKETEYKLKNVVEFVQIMVAMIIMIVMTALTLISSETATISPNSPV